MADFTRRARLRPADNTVYGVPVAPIRKLNTKITPSLAAEQPIRDVGQKLSPKQSVVFREDLLGRKTFNVVEGEDDGASADRALEIKPVVALGAAEVVGETVGAATGGVSTGE